MYLLEVVGAENVTDKIVKTLNAKDGLMITLIIFLSINIIALVAKYFLDKELKKQDIRVNKKMAITNISIKTEADLFLKLENLKNFQKSEYHEMLDSIIEIESFLVTNRIFICVKIFSLANEFLDYFKSVNSNYNEKDLKKEKEFTKKFSKQYYGE